MKDLTLYFPETNGFERAESLLEESGFEYEIGYEEDLEEEDEVILGERKPTLVVDAFDGISITHKGLPQIEKALENLDQSKYPTYDEDSSSPSYT